jgi:hypothetical protein
MNCANCGKPITDNSISEDNYYFCTALCRYDWRQKGKPNPFTSIKKPVAYESVTEIDLDFPIEPVGFEKRNLLIKPSYWTAPKVFLDGKRLISFRKKLFSRTRDYNAVSNFGKNVVLRVKYRPFDMVPNLYIDGQEFQIARPLTKWEYFWICLPIILMFWGGAIGGLIGGVATYSNSILIRKLKNIFLRYLFTGGTTFMAFTIFIRFVGFVNPYLTNLATPITFDRQLREGAVEVNRICPKMIDNETRLDSASVPKEKTFSYYYTLVNRAKKDIDIASARQILTPNLIQNIRTNEQLRFMRENQVVFIYSYADKNGSKVLDIQVSPYDYK